MRTILGLQLLGFTIFGILYGNIADYRIKKVEQEKAKVEQERDSAIGLILEAPVETLAEMRI